MKIFDIFTQKIKSTFIHQFTVRHCNNIAAIHSQQNNALLYFQLKQETLRAVTIAMIYSILASPGKFQCFPSPIFKSVKHL